MELQPVCVGFTTPTLRIRSIQRQLSPKTVPRGQRFHLGFASKLSLLSGSQSALRGRGLLFLSWESRTIACASSSDASLKLSRKQRRAVPSISIDRLEPLGGKPGCVSFYGVSHQSVDEHRIVSAPFDPDKGSFFWISAPIALISSLIVPRLLLSPAIGAFLQDQVLAETLTSMSSDTMFYVGLATFLLVTDQIQRPYLEFSPKRWGLITGLRGYLTSAFLTMGLKVTLPIVVAYVTWPALGFSAVVAFAPFLLGCLVQRVFEFVLEGRKSSCWPVIPIIFEVYRLYQLTRSAHFVQRLMFLTNGLPQSPQLYHRTGALISMIVTFQILGLACLWSLVTFLLRLFPSRPVVENY